MDILKLKERVELAIEVGESYYREFKSAHDGKPDSKVARDVKEICYDVAKTLVAFANADGGELFVGIEDNGTISGVAHNDEKVQIILNSPKTHILADTPVPLKRSAIINYEGKKIVYFSVDKGTKFVHLTSKGECFQRKDRESEPTSSEKIRLQRDEETSREYDRQFVDLAKISDLDLALINTVSQNIFRAISPEKFLQYLELAEFDGEKLKLRRASLLLFAKNPSKWHPRLQVRILKIKGLEEKTGKEFNIQEVGEANGNIFELIERSWELLRPHLTETRFSENSLFKTQIIYPESACKEALINSITHRDYSAEGTGIEVKIFDDRLVVVNPGELLSSISISDLEQLKGTHQSRNTYVARVLREFGYIRELGEGIRRIFELMNQNDLIKPKIESNSKTFAMALFYKHSYSKEEKLWIDQFERFHLSREQKTVIRLGINGRLVSTKEIFEQVGIVSEESYRQLIVSLRELGILHTKLSQHQVSGLKRKYGYSRKAVPRFQITIPEIKINQPKANNKDLDTSEYAKIYVTNVSYDATEEDLLRIFEKFGEVADVSIPLNFYNKKSRGFAFIEFDKKEDANRAVEFNEPILLNDRRLFIQVYKK